MSAGTGPGERGGRTVDLDGPVHYVDFGGQHAGGPALVLVHGLGGSHLNWDLVAPVLARTNRVLALDLPGFGLSEPGERIATVSANVRVLERFVREVAGGASVLVGNSMGGMISILLTARRPELVRGLVLLDSALPPPLSTGRNVAVTALYLLVALPGVGEALMRERRRRYGARRIVQMTMQYCGVDPGLLPAELVDRSVELFENHADVSGMDRAYLSATRSLIWVLARRSRYRQAMARVAAPVLLVHGDRDPLVPVSAARAVARRHPEWRYVELAGVGHVPQLQVPDRVAAEILGWLAALNTNSPAA